MAKVALACATFIISFRYGQLEAAAAVILANCPLVEAIQEQPLQIWYVWRETESGLEIRLLDQQSAARPVEGSETPSVAIHSAGLGQAVVSA